jgi:L-amino acid N-acyltransferase YncA
MIRPIEPDDLNAVADIYNYYIANTVISFEEAPLSREQIEQRVKKITSAGLPWFIVEENKEILGYAYADHWNKRRAYRNTVEVSVYLSPKYCAKGLGTLLYQALFKRLKELSFHVVIGGVTLPNPASCRLHEKFGMTKIAHFSEVGYKFGAWHDVGYWQVTLDI